MDNTVDILGFQSWQSWHNGGSSPSGLKNLAKTIIQTWDTDGCFDIGDFADMFDVGH